MGVAKRGEPIKCGFFDEGFSESQGKISILSIFTSLLFHRVRSLALLESLETSKNNLCDFFRLSSKKSK